MIAEARKEPRWRVWWRLARPFSLTASIVPAAVGAAVAIGDGTFRSPSTLGAMLAASMLIQIATNMFNEYYDYKRGLDRHDTVGIAGAIVRDSFQPIWVFAAASGCFGVALGLGLWVVAQTDPLVFVIGVICALAGYLYTGGPFPIAYTPLGEIEVFVFMGPVMIGLFYFTQAGAISPAALWASAPVACLVAGILLANNLRDIVGDARARRSTLPIMVGRKTAALLYAALLTAAFASTVAAVAAAKLPLTALLPLATLGSAARLIRLFHTKEGPETLNPGVRGSAALHARFGLLLALGIGLGPAIGQSPLL
ncbi:MAG: 1,4-dihydroxy-2-naphthoate polyprenyltransferase [Chloroflexi bacterium]|nr:1,4-dihydroxy-2-naphthoate polyprenyltransferase [Chloroflexota bacterium]